MVEISTGSKFDHHPKYSLTPESEGMAEVSKNKCFECPKYRQQQYHTFARLGHH